MGEKPDYPVEPEPQHLTGVNKWVHEAIKNAYETIGNGRNENSAGNEHRSLAVKALDFLQIIPYAEYYGAYNAAHAINAVGEKLGAPGKVISHILNLPLAAMQAEGLLENELISLEILKINDGHANLYEGINGTVVPHFAWNEAPVAYLPGIHRDGQIDFEW